jgi:hypothetical protein
MTTPPPTKKPLPLKYCPICGRILKQTPFVTYYSMYTGEAYNHWEWVCPNKKWYNNHSKFKTDESGDGNAYSY